MGRSHDWNGWEQQQGLIRDLYNMPSGHAQTSSARRGCQGGNTRVSEILCIFFTDDFFKDLEG